MIKDSAKTIVCYGDSNTWGRIPNGERYPRSIRWTGALQNLLGDDYDVKEEGVGGRTLVFNDTENPYRTGITHLKAIIRTHRPIDLIIIMLGGNDVKDRFNLSPEDIGEHLKQTIDLIRAENSAKILVVCPADIVQKNDGIPDERFIQGIKKMKLLPAVFRKVAEENNCAFMNAQDFIASSTADGLHLEPEAHQKLAEVLCEKIKSII
jgi:lysophospholipase L1-like esterase